MIRSVDLHVEIQEDGEFAYSFRAEGDDVDLEQIAVSALVGVEALLRQGIGDEKEAQDPLGNPEFHRGTTALEARLLLMDLVCHLPDKDQSGIITVIE